MLAPPLYRPVASEENLTQATTCVFPASPQWKEENATGRQSAVPKKPPSFLIWLSPSPQPEGRGCFGCAVHFYRFHGLFFKSRAAA